MHRLLPRAPPAQAPTRPLQAQHPPEPRGSDHSRRAQRCGVRLRLQARRPLRSTATPTWAGSPWPAAMPAVTTATRTACSRVGLNWHWAQRLFPRILRIPSCPPPPTTPSLLQHTPPPPPCVSTCPAPPPRKHTKRQPPPLLLPPYCPPPLPSILPTPWLHAALSLALPRRPQHCQRHRAHEWPVGPPAAGGHQPVAAAGGQPRQAGHLRPDHAQVVRPGEPPGQLQP